LRTACDSGYMKNNSKVHGRYSGQMLERVKRAEDTRDTFHEGDGVSEKSRSEDLGKREN
jgi:hypothetical protein